MATSRLKPFNDQKKVEVSSLASLSPNISLPIKISLEKLANNIGCIQDKTGDNYQGSKNVNSIYLQVDLQEKQEETL